MMKNYRNLVIILVITISACDKKQTLPPQESPLLNGKNSSNVKKYIRAEDSARSIRDVAKAKLRRDDLFEPGIFEESATLLRQLTRDLEIQENTSYHEALNELYIALVERQPKGISMMLKGLFYQVMLKDPEGIATVMGKLPAGDLRGVGLSFILGSGLPIQELEDVYWAMPESYDRSQIANQLVVSTYLEKSIDTSLALIQSMNISPERDGALEYLVSFLVTADLTDGKRVSKDDLEKVKSFVKLIGQERRTKILDRL
jgi:hypothetical protein